MSNPITVFYSWQSDLPNSVNRGFIGDAIERAIKQLRRDETIIEAERPDLQRDSDTQGVPGSPAIPGTILQKIDNCAVFVADVSTIGQAGEKRRPTPNPNVLFELGYAWHVLTSTKVLLVSNAAFSLDPEHPERDLPFDLQVNRLISYSLREGEDKANAREQLVRSLVASLRAMLPSIRILPPRPPVDWRSWLGADFGSVFFQQEYRLDWDRDGQPEPVVVVGTQSSDGGTALHLMVFRFLNGGWNRVQIRPIQDVGWIMLCSVDMHHFTSEFWPDFVIHWNGGGSGSTIAILRGNAFSYELTRRNNQGLDAPFGVGSQTWTSHYRYQVFYHSIPDNWQEEIVEYLLFDLDHARKAPSIAQVLRNHPLKLTDSLWIQRSWRWDDRTSQFVVANQALSDGPSQD